MNPAALSPWVNSPSASTQFSDVFCGSDTPITEPAGKPAVDAPDPLVEAPALEPRPLPHAARVSTQAATAATVAVLASLLIETSSIRAPRDGERGSGLVFGRAIRRIWPGTSCLRSRHPTRASQLVAQLY